MIDTQITPPPFINKVSRVFLQTSAVTYFMRPELAETFERRVWDMPAPEVPVGTSGTSVVHLKIAHCCRLNVPSIAKKSNIS